MSRIRSIHPGFFTDEDIVSVSMAARMLFLGLGVEADDKGIFEWKPLTLKMRIFPADSIEVAPLLDELAGAGKIMSYEIDGKRFGAIGNFAKFQRPKNPNDIHPATDEALEFTGHSEKKIPPKAEAKSPKGEMNGAKVGAFPLLGEIDPQMEEGEEDGEEIEAKASRPSGDEPSLRPEHVVEKWNEIAPGMGKPKVRDITPERRQLLKARIAQYSIDDFVTVFGNIRGSPFLRGDTGKHFCTFDWAMKKANFQKIIEGNYGD
ncbi:hypothetical protein [Sphingopyxis lindanitolerans]|nr:hypothetical protein [Sphingopyxis lindanitolerans]